MLPSNETQEWVADIAAWWLGNFGGFDTFAARTPTVLPTEDDFPVDLSLEGEDLLDDYLGFVLAHAGLDEWPIVATLDEAPDVSQVLRGMPHGFTGPVEPDPVAAHLAEDDPLVIPCDPRLLGDPSGLIAHLARGVAHYHLYDARTPAPVDDDQREFVVDLATCFLGFGCFAANAAFRFSQHENGMLIGWGFQRAGALSELDVSYVVGLVAELLDTPAHELEAHLRPNPRAYVRDARRALRRGRTTLDRLRQVVSAPTGPYR